MSEVATISIQILLPEAIDRRFARRVADLEGASWPGWGGHITLVPSFIPRVPPEDVLARVTAVCEQIEPFALHIAEPAALPDLTRPGYFAVFLTVPDAEVEDFHRLKALRDELMAALTDCREDINPELADQPFLAHVTLALSVGETEARRAVQALRADGIQAEFRVDEIWVLTRSGEGVDGTRGRSAVRLGPPPPINLLSD